MKCIWLGQGGLLFDFDGFKVMVDPYFSDSVGAQEPAKKRRVPMDPAFLEIRPDVLILTHDHLDHTDPETLAPLLQKHRNICVLASGNAWNRVRAFGGDHNYVQFNEDTVWTQGPVRFLAIHAQHSDSAAIGVVLHYGSNAYYITGDTLYHRQVIEGLARWNITPDVVFLPVNGVGNNMNMVDASSLAQQIGAKQVVPIHFGLFDDLNPEKDFPCDRKVIPEYFREIPL